MYTFNFGIIFGAGSAGGVHTIVCASEFPIDEEKVAAVVTERLPAVLAGSKGFNSVTSKIAAAIKDECDCTAVIVRADATVHILPVK